MVPPKINASLECAYLRRLPMFDRQGCHKRGNIDGALCSFHLPKGPLLRLPHRKSRFRFSLARLLRCQKRLVLPESYPNLFSNNLWMPAGTLSASGDLPPHQGQARHTGVLAVSYGQLTLVQASQAVRQSKGARNGTSRGKCLQSCGWLHLVPPEFLDNLHEEVTTSTS